MPEPESLLLKLRKSVAWSWPVLTMEAKGRFRVKELVEVEILKILPRVPVAIFIMTLVFIPMVEVLVMEMPVPWVKSVLILLKEGLALAPLEESTW